MAEEINPRTGKPYSTNPRAVSSRRKTQQKKSNAANQRQVEKDLQINPDNQPIGDNVLTPEEIEVNKEGAQKARQIIEEGKGINPEGEIQGDENWENDGFLRSALQIATTQGPQALNEAQKSLLIKNGYDDFVRGGQTQSPLGDLATLGLSALAAKPIAAAAVAHPWAAAGTAMDVIFPPESTEEALLSLVTQKQELQAATKILRPIYRKGKSYVQSKLDEWFSSSRFRPAYEGATESVYEASRHSDEVSNVSKIEGDVPTQKDITPNITKKNEKALKKMGLWEYFREFDVTEHGGKVTRTQAGALVSPEATGFSKATAERVGKLPELRSFYENLTDMDILAELDHINPLKLTAYLMDKTTGAQRVGIRKILLEEGINYGDMIENMQALPREVHAVWTRNMNRVMGKQLDTFLAEMSTLGITKPEDIAREYARRIKLQRSKFDTIYEAHKRTYGSVADSNIDDLVSKLDEAYELGDEWAPARTRDTRRNINQDLSNLDETPLNLLPEGNAGLQEVVERLGLTDLRNVDLEEFSKLSLPEQMNQLQKRSGMSITDIQELLRTHNIDIQSILDLIE